MRGFDCLGWDELGEAVVTIPTAGASYTDAKTVVAVQAALVKKGYNLGNYGPDHNGVDGVLGPKTANAIKSVQKVIGEAQTGKIDEGVIMALQVTPGVLPPGVTIQGRAALQAQVALDAATKVEHAQTPTDVQIVAKELADAMVFEPVEIRLPVEKALAKAKAATTPAQVADAAKDVKAAALAANAAVKPSWWTTPAWSGGIERWKVASIGAGGAIGLGALFAWMLSSATKAVK
jgi:peptidoglycan hydrolase-like protein with peptidoglycan-binding domain